MCFYSQLYSLREIGLKHDEMEKREARQEMCSMRQFVQVLVKTIEDGRVYL